MAQWNVREKKNHVRKEVEWPSLSDVLGGLSKMEMEPLGFNKNGQHW